MTLNHLLRTGVTALGALAIASVTQASASDLYAGGGSLKDAPIGLPSWSGFYIGGHLGAAWANLDLDHQHFDDGVVIKTPNSDPIFGGGNLNTTGAFGGAQLGYNWQNGNCCFVFGIELDIGGLAGDDEKSFLAVTPGGTAGLVRFKRDGGFYGDITGRLGYTWGSNVLVYAKGGFAWLNSDIKVDETIVAPGPGGPITHFGNDHNDTITGWTVGGGFEYMMNPNWTMKVEYLHFDFSNDDNTCCGDNFGNTFKNNADLTVDTVKLGFNYLIHSTPDVIPYK